MFLAAALIALFAFGLLVVLTRPSATEAGASPSPSVVPTISFAPQPSITVTVAPATTAPPSPTTAAPTVAPTTAAPTPSAAPSTARPTTAPTKSP